MMTQTTGGSAAPHRGAIVLVLGILSLVVCAFLGPFAWIMGRGDLEKMEGGQMDQSGRGLTQAGMICGIIGTVFLALGVLGFIVWLIFIVMLSIGAAAAAGAAI